MNRVTINRSSISYCPPIVVIIKAPTNKVFTTYNLGIQEDNKVEDNKYSCYSITFVNEYTLTDVVKTVVANKVNVSIGEWREIVAHLHADYGTIVAAFVNARYTQDEMQAIINNRLISLDTGIMSLADDEYAQMQEWRLYAKRLAKEVLNEV